MRWLGTIRLQVRTLFRRHAAESELDDELRFHLERTIEQNLARGMTREEARRQALVEIGGVEQVKQECREARGWQFLADTWRDVTYGARMLRKSPGFAVVAILTLALGIGANVSMLGVVDALLFRLPVGLEAPGQLVKIEIELSSPNGKRFYDLFGYHQYQRLAENEQLLQLAATTPASMEVGLGRGITARQVRAAFVSHGYFRVLGAHMLLGRTFTAAEDQPTGSPPVVLLGYDLWQQRFDGDPSVLGRSVFVAGEARTVIGVAPKGFTGTGFQSVGAWLPIRAFSLSFRGQSTGVMVIGRLRRGATTEQATADVTGVLRHGGGSANEKVRVEPLFAGRWSKLSSNARISLWIAGVALLVLLIACVNVSTLLLARMAQRRHEMAVRQQLGATRGRLARQVLVECLMLSAAGGAGALLVVLATQPLVRSFLLPPGFYEGRFLNWRMLGLTAALATLAGCASGLAPAWGANARRMAETLKWGERGHTREGSALRWALVVVQIALTLLLAVGAGLFIRSLHRIEAVNLGFQPEHVLLASVNLNPADFKTAEANTAYQQLLARAEHVPGVAGAALTNIVPFWSSFYETMTVKTDAGKLLVHWAASPYAITPSYFSTMGIRILKGRPLLSSDRAGTPPVAVVDQSLARDLWPGQDPVGKCMRISPKTACARVVGLVPDVYPYSSSPESRTEKSDAFYVPLSQAVRRGTLWPKARALLMRTTGKPSAVAASVFAALESVVPGERYVNVRPFSKVLDGQTRSWRLGASMFSLFGALALILAAVGIYGVLAFLVRQRTAEIGMRMALGATPGNVLRMVIGEGMKVAAIGIVIGAGAALALTRLMKSLLYGVSATDPLTFAAAGAVLALVTLLACFLAAHRAMRVDPNVALRYE